MESIRGGAAKEGNLPRPQPGASSRRCPTATDMMEKAWQAWADADTMEEGRRAFRAAMSGAARAPEETT